MGKILAREFLWLVVSLIVSLLLGVVFLWFLGYTPKAIDLTTNSKNYIFWLYIAGYLSSVLGIYIIRFVAISVEMLTKPEEVEE